MKTNVQFWSYLAHFFLEWEMFQTKVVEKLETHFMFNNFFFFKKSAFNEIMWKNIVERGRPQMTVWRMRFSCWIQKATNIHSECVILIAFPLQQWYTNAPECYNIRTLLVLSFKIELGIEEWTKRKTGIWEDERNKNRGRRQRTKKTEIIERVRAWREEE
jgi:hypothetical protein